MKTYRSLYPSPTFIIPLTLVLITTNFQTISAHSYSTEPTIFRRELSCELEASAPCEVKGYCCPSDSRCIPIENKTSVVCCKNGEYCDQIFPINCESTPSPTRPASSNPPSKVIQCGRLCCPEGYNCGPNGDRCVMKDENVPDDHRKHRKEQDRKERESLIVGCQKVLNQTKNDNGEGNGVKGGKHPPKIFSVVAVSVGLFPGILLGVVIMFGYTKIIEMKTRRRTINFNNPSPDDISWAERRSYMQQHESIAIGYSPDLDLPGSRNISPSNWKPITPADLSPNLGPKIPPRERSTSSDTAESRMANSRSTPVRQTPSPHPLAAGPLEPRAQSSPRSSTDSETDHSESFLSSTITNTRASSSTRDLHPPDRTSNQRRHFSSGVASIITDAGSGFNGVGLGSQVMTEKERGRGRSGISIETGYSDSEYQDGSSFLQPFAFEDEVPHLHPSGAQSPLSAIREQSSFASTFNPNSPATQSPFTGGTPPSRFGRF